MYYIYSETKMEAILYLKPRVLIVLLVVWNIVIGVPLFIFGKGAFAVAFIFCVTTLGLGLLFVRSNKKFLTLAYRQVDASRLARIRYELLWYGIFFLGFPMIAAILAVLD